jgi:hypothetical protein
MSARQISSPLGSINRIAFGGTEPWTLMLVTTLARIDFAAAKSGALNSPLAKTPKSPGEPRVEINSYFQRDSLRDNLTSQWMSLFSAFFNAQSDEVVLVPSRI